MPNNVDAVVTRSVAEEMKGEVLASEWESLLAGWDLKGGIV